MKVEYENIIDFYLGEIINEDILLKMKKYTQHGKIDTFEHSKNVAKMSYYLKEKLRLDVDEKSLLVGAMLHDFYLYDWHLKDKARPLHGTSHPKIAKNNAINYFDINEIEQGIILSHMWPLNFFDFPKTKEAWIVCIADKICAVSETIKCLKKPTF